jgi:hypothetical protein
MKHHASRCRDKEETMQPNLDIHRHSDGSMDFDFYRRRASRLRRLYKRLIFKQWLAQATAITLFVLSTAKSLSCAGERPPQRARGLIRASALTMLLRRRVGGAVS